MIHLFLRQCAPVVRVLALSLSMSGSVFAQTTPAVPAQAEARPAASSVGGVQSANIFSIAPDANTDPKYADQTNAERGKVQPGNNAPMWRQVGAGVTGYSSLPVTQAPEAGNLIQPFVQYPGSRLTNAGEAWRQVRNQWIIPYGGALLLIVVGAIALFYWRKGTMALHGQETGRQIERFTPFERSAHWANAIAFCALAVSGVVMAFGKFFILPIVGTTIFGWLAYALKNAHNFAGPLFAVSLVVVIATFVRDNLPARERPELAPQGWWHVVRARNQVGPFQCRREGGVLGWCICAGLVVVASGWSWTRCFLA